MLITIEYCIVCIAGAVLYLILSTFIQALRHAGVYLPAVMLCFVGGILAAVLVETRKSVLKALQFKE